jgi:hypothetical protein
MGTSGVFISLNSLHSNQGINIFMFMCPAALSEFY